MRVAVVNQHLDDVVGGSELQCDLVARGLAARGHEVTYVAVGSTRPDPGGRPYRTVPSAAIPANVARAIIDSGPDLVYWRYNRRGLREVATELARVDVPLVVALAHVDDVTPWPSWPLPGAGSTARDRASDLRSRLRWRRQFAAFREVSAIASQREDLIGRVPLGIVPLQRHVPNLMDPALEGAPPFLHPRPFVAWVANLKARKRPELLPALADALASHGVDLILAGPVQDPRYGWLAGPLPEHPNLHHVGVLTTPEVVALLAAARCLAVTAMPEGFSNVMLQAWWAGTPTVSLDYDPDGLVAREGLGVVAGGDPGRFRDEVLALATDQARSGALGAHCASFARGRFAPEGVLDALEELLESALGTRRSGAERQ